MSDDFLKRLAVIDRDIQTGDAKAFEEEKRFKASNKAVNARFQKFITDEIRPLAVQTMTGLTSHGFHSAFNHSLPNDLEEQIFTVLDFSTRGRESYERYSFTIVITAEDSEIRCFAKQRGESFIDAEIDITDISVATNTETQLLHTIPHFMETYYKQVLSRMPN